MTNFKYNFLRITDNNYKCIMTIYNDYFILYKEDLIKYMNSSRFDIIFFNDKKITFATHLINYNIIEKMEIIHTIYKDVMYVFNILKDDKKILRHYPSLVR